LKQQEEKWCEHLKALRAQEDHIREQMYQEHVVIPVKRDFADLLAKTGDTISDEGLENLAKSRLDP
jgi:Tfp pilus assembly protein PilO